MLADVSSVPAWKQALLEKKRQHDVETRQKREEEVKRLADMPAWKRNILGKKHQHKSSTVFLSTPAGKAKCRSSSSRSSSNNDCSPTSLPVPLHSSLLPVVVDDVFEDTTEQRTSQTNTDDVAVAEEHISTICQNPWFRSQGMRKKSNVQRTMSSPDYIYNSENRSRSTSFDGQQKQLDQNDNYNMDGADCADAEEVTYGKGFVHKLLEKFKHLTAKEQEDMFLCEKTRTQSTDTILTQDNYQSDRFNRARRLSGSEKTDATHTFDLSQKRAQSVDNLHLPLKVYDKRTPEKDTKTCSHVDGSVENGNCATSNGSTSDIYNVTTFVNVISADAVIQDSIIPTVTDTVINGETGEDEEQDTGSRRSIVLDRRSQFEKLIPLKPKRRAPLPPNLQPQVLLDNSITNKVSNTEVTRLNVGNYASTKTVPEEVTTNNTDATVVCNGVTDKTEVDSMVSSGQISQQNAKQDVSLINIPSASKSWSLTGSKSDVTDKSQSSRDCMDTPPEVTSPLSPNSSRSFLYRTVNNTESRASSMTVTQKTVPAAKKVVQKDDKTSDVGRQNLNLHLNGNSAPTQNTTHFSGQASLKKTTTKRPASSGPGSLLIRPASNLVVGNSSAQYLKLNKYNDITKGEFAPANKKPSYYDDEYSDDEDDVPVTNIDDYLADDMPVTDIDSQISPREGTVDDAPQQRKRSKFDFTGAGVTFGKNLLVKTPGRSQLRIVFNESAPSIYEYPSEQCLLEQLPPEKGDFDYIDQDGMNDADYSQPSAILKSTPGISHERGLGAYQARYQESFQWGTSRQSMDTVVPPSRPPVKPEPSTALVEDDASGMFSGGPTSDMLF